MITEFINDGTYLHVPDRILDDTLLTFNLPEVIQKIKQEKTWQTKDRNAITLLKSGCMRIVLIALHENAEINFHHSVNFISVQTIEGKIKLNSNRQCGILNKGSLVTIHGSIQHSFVAVEESVLLLTIAL